jgi:anti-sigma regulatory factor (Ser/Thr protein kinase)
MTAPVPWSVQTHWPPDPRHVGDARRFVVERLVADGLEDLADTAGLIVSELATNALKHAGTDIRLTLARDAGQLWLEIHDDSATSVQAREAGPWDQSGRGLEIVSVLSSDWGVTPDRRGGKSVWAALDVSDPGGGLRP